MKVLLRGALALGCLVGAAAVAAAADGGGGPGPYERAYYPSIWQGFYGGVQAGFGWAGDASGGFGGGQVGYNWRSQQFVYGLEADIAAADIGVSGSATACQPGFGCATARASGSIDWFATIRGRAGILVQPGLLLYATAGVGIVNAEAHGRVFVTGGPSLSASISETDSGFVAGVGVESKLNETMSVRLEYLNFGNDNDVVGDFGIIRAGLNFRFGN